jgi:hypothetical protein
MGDSYGSDPADGGTNGTTIRKALERKKNTAAYLCARNGGFQLYDLKSGVYTSRSPPETRKLNIAYGYEETIRQI